MVRQQDGYIATLLYVGVDARNKYTFSLTLPRDHNDS